MASSHQQFKIVSQSLVSKFWLDYLVELRRSTKSSTNVLEMLMLNGQYTWLKQHKNNRPGTEVYHHRNRVIIQHKKKADNKTWIIVPELYVTVKRSWSGRIWNINSSSSIRRTFFMDGRRAGSSWMHHTAIFIVLWSFVMSATSSFLTSLCSSPFKDVFILGQFEVNILSMAFDL